MPLLVVPAAPEPIKVNPLVGELKDETFGPGAEPRFVPRNNSTGKEVRVRPAEPTDWRFVQAEAPAVIVMMLTPPRLKVSAPRFSVEFNVAFPT